MAWVGGFRGGADPENIKIHIVHLAVSGPMPRFRQARPQKRQLETEKPGLH
jgi:hypothetical protein